MFVCRLMEGSGLREEAEECFEATRPRCAVRLDTLFLLKIILCNVLSRIGARGDAVG
jgi:hypothetical protein